MRPHRSVSAARSNGAGAGAGGDAACPRFRRIASAAAVPSASRVSLRFVGQGATSLALASFNSVPVMSRVFIKLSGTNRPNRG